MFVASLDPPPSRRSYVAETLLFFWLLCVCKLFHYDLYVNMTFEKRDDIQKAMQPKREPIVIVVCGHSRSLIHYERINGQSKYLSKRNTMKRRRKKKRNEQQSTRTCGSGLTNGIYRPHHSRVFHTPCRTAEHIVTPIFVALSHTDDIATEGGGDAFKII